MSDIDLTYLADRASEQIASLVKDAFTAGSHTGYKAGYEAGYSAAIATLQAAQTNASRTSDERASDVAGHSPMASVPSSAIAEVIPKTVSGRAAPGSIKNLVKQFVLTAGKPVKESDFAYQYPNIIRPSRYMAFRTLGADGVIVKRDGFWVPAPQGGGNPDAPTSGS